MTENHNTYLPGFLQRLNETMPGLIIIILLIIDNAVKKDFAYN